ncbi:glycoside hydrolase, partial [Coniella lustricola]
RMVFAHYMVGLTYGQTLSDWTHEIRTAQAASIDGFALNIGPNDPYTLTQLRFAFEAAEGLFTLGHADEEEEDDGGGGAHQRLPPPFVLFLSFDMAAREWSVEQVVELIREFTRSRVYYHHVDERAMVSTFEGPGWADHWESVRRQVGGADGDGDGGQGIFFVPDWSSLGPHGVAGKLAHIDGAFSWAAWPRAGEERITGDEDREYLREKEKEDKVYMAGVSPWFYTRLPQWNKNWYSSSERLWYDRWMQILELQPDYVQIITWNDYGESSYICDPPTRPSQVVPGAEVYVSGHPHAALRATLPFLVRAYKSAGLKDCSRAEQLVTTVDDSDNDNQDNSWAVAWYKPQLARCGPDGGTVWGQAGTRSAALGARDVVSVMAVSSVPTTITLYIGNGNGNGDGDGDKITRPPHPHEHHHHHHHQHQLSFHEIPLHGRTGAVTMAMRGKGSVTGPAVRGQCVEGEVVGFNCVVIGV